MLYISMTIHLVFTDEILGSASQRAAFAFDAERVGSGIMECTLFVRQMHLVAVSIPDTQVQLGHLICASALLSCGVP